MAYAITQSCCTDASCVSVCPVNCIHPAPGEPGFGSTEMLYIDPATCIDCGACADACPVDAIRPVELLGQAERGYAERNRAHFDTHPSDHAWGPPNLLRTDPPSPGIRVAVVGTGPAAGYAAQSLLVSAGGEVTMLDRLPVPGGLVRSGVAPDHPSTKRIGDRFAGLYQNPRLRLFTNVEVGTDISHAELAAHHDAVVYAVGASADRELGVPGEQLPGSVSAGDLVRWYNAHPDASAWDVDLSASRAVVVGNGNVALDAARMLLGDPDRLAHTDIADHALATLRESQIREVVVLGRRGPEHAAYTRSELEALRQLPDTRLVVADDSATRDAIEAAAPGTQAALLREIDVEPVDWSMSPPTGKRIVLRFHARPVEILGESRVHAVRLECDTIPTALVVRSIGHRGTGVAGLPLDPATGVLPNEAGRVIDPTTGQPLAGTYVVGWAKRGPSGGIGRNRACAAETVDALLEDAVAGRLTEPTGTARQFARLVRRRKPDALRRRQTMAIDRAERRSGERDGRPRVKFATLPDLLAAGSDRGR